MGRQATSTFLAWSREQRPARRLAVLAYTGMRRGELLALRWRDVDLDAATITIRRSAGPSATRAESAEITEGDTKTNKPRVIDIDPGTVEVLRAWKRERGALALALAAPSSLVFGDIEGGLRHPERFSRLQADRGPRYPRGHRACPRSGCMI